MSVQKNGQAMCHVKVREVAKEAAHQLYERVMGDNQVYETWQRQNPGCTQKELQQRFVERNWGKCLEYARATLALMLRSPSVPESVKEEVMDVLEKDQSLMRMGGRAIVLPGGYRIDH